MPRASHVTRLSLVTVICLLAACTAVQRAAGAPIASAAAAHSSTDGNDWYGGNLQAAAKILHKSWEGDSSNQQCFGFSIDQSIAREKFEYPDTVTGQRRTAKKGDLISMRCDSVVCPNPPVPDCYMNEDICAEDEWCQLEDQVRFGPWAMAEGETPNLSAGDCAFFQEHGYDWIFDQVCKNNSHWGPWQAVRGRCSKYRQEQQSCNAYFAAAVPGPTKPHHHHHHHHHTSDDKKKSSKQHSKGNHHHLDQSQDIGVDFAADADAGDSSLSFDAGPATAAHRRHLLTPVESFHPSSSIAAAAEVAVAAQVGDDAGSDGEQLLIGAAGAARGSAQEEVMSQLWPHYVVSEEDGKAPIRPQLCAPGLVCTGDVHPLPNTCVRVRPPNTCYQGPWWDSSSWCKVGGTVDNKIYGGLPLDELKHVAQALLVQLPVEHFTNPLNPKFWHSPSADVARAKIQGIVAALWPDTYRAATSFPLQIPDPRNSGAVHTTAWNTTAEKATALYRQSNKVWSTIQSLIHNCKDPMPWTQVAASRSLAVWLRQHFMCCNCRGMWANYVLNNLGLPPKSSSRYDHTLWWWRAQNMVSEHAASSRGGHPWVWPSQTNEEFKRTYAEYRGKLNCQNPWFLPYEFAELMWKISP